MVERRSKYSVYMDEWRNCLSEHLRGLDRVTARAMRIGDEVELVIGKYAGLRGKIKLKQPRLTPFAIRILVDVDLSKYVGMENLYKELKKRFRRWQKASAWRVIK